MKQFEYTVRDPMGIHARPAVMLVRLVRTFPETAITLTRGGKTVKAGQILELMDLDVRSGETVTVAAEGGDETAVIESLYRFFSENL